MIQSIKLANRAIVALLSFLTVGVLGSCTIPVTFQGDERPSVESSNIRVFQSLAQLDSLKQPYDLTGYMTAEGRKLVSRGQMRSRLVDEAARHGGDGIVFVDIDDLKHGLAQVDRGPGAELSPSPLFDRAYNGDLSAKRVAAYMVIFLPAKSASVVLDSSKNTR